jgi:hypothetical protein
MYRKLPLFFALFVFSCMAYADTYRCKGTDGYYAYSATPCSSGSGTEATSIQNQSDSNSRTEQSAHGEAYTKDLTPVNSPDAATQACFNYRNTTAQFPDPVTTRLLSSTKKWVTVKDVGGRQLVTIRVTSKNEAGMYVGVESFDCLLMGDNATINTGDYELL